MRCGLFHFCRRREVAQGRHGRLTGGGGGGRTLPLPVLPLSYRLYVAGDAGFAASAGAHCPILPDEVAITPVSCARHRTRNSQAPGDRPNPLRKLLIIRCRECGIRPSLPYTISCYCTLGVGRRAKVLKFRPLFWPGNRPCPARSGEAVLQAQPLRIVLDTNALMHFGADGMGSAEECQFPLRFHRQTGDIPVGCLR